MVDKASEGKIAAEFPIDVEKGKIREFARAIFAEHPAFFDGEKPVIPPTFLTTAFFWEREVSGSDALEFVKFDPSRSVHAEQEYVFHGPPPRAGDRLIARSRVERIYEKASRSGGVLTFVVIATEFRDHDGKLVAEARMTAVEKAASS